MKKKVNPLFVAVFKYHANMIDFCNLRQSLGLISEDKAEETNKKHCMGAIKAAYFGGFASNEVKQLMEKKKGQ